MTEDPRPIVALMLGDSTGIGPEISARALTAGTLQANARIVVVGDARVLAMGIADAGVVLPWRGVASVGAIDWDAPEVPVIDLGNIDPAGLSRGEVSPESGRVVGETLAYALELGKRGEVAAITFAPLNKRALHDGGFPFPDEHKMFAHMLAHNGHHSEMNVLDGQWMSRVTSHVSLREAIEQITPERIADAITLADTTMKRAGIERPRLAVCALNPHAGENGLFGTEEIEIIRPTVERMAATGIECSGPYPSDTVFIRAFKGEFDGVLSMYHDQGQIATKLQGFNRGVTVAAGMRVILTTPAHGTAFDIVGRGVADIGALENAVALAARLVARQKLLEAA